jgi:hypothetical protein
MFAVSAAVVAAGIAISIVFAVNYAPVLIWGSDVLIVSPYFTGIPSLIAGVIVFGICFTKIQAWLCDGLSKIESRPSIYRLVFAISSMLIGLFCIYLSSIGLRSQFFKVKWTEEIRLDNGELITLQRLRTYQRFGFRIEKYKDSRVENTTLIFEPSKGEPKVTLKTALEPVYLNFFEGKWFLVLSGRDEYRDKALNPDEQDWGKEYNTMGQRLAILDGGKFIPTTWDKAPNAIVLYNLITNEVFKIEKYYGDSPHIVLEAEKRELIRAHLERPPGPDPLRITRHQAMKKSMEVEYKTSKEEIIWGGK